VLRKKRVLILSEGFGTGHTRAAQALAANIRRNSPNVQTRVFELGSFLNPTIGRWILGAYRRTVSKQPKLVGMLYRSQYEKSLNRLTQLALHRIFYTQTAAMLKQLQPDAIVCTHPFPNIIISRLKRLGLRIPLCTVITDYDVHGTWLCPEVNQYLVSTESMKTKLLAKGVREHVVKVTGMPVHPDFWMPMNREEIRSDFSLKDLPTVLVMGGGWGLMDNDNIYQEMLQWRERMQFIFVLGQNKKAHGKMNANPLFHHENIRLMGYTKNVSHLMEVADLLITKPGGMTCSEAYVKRLPMLFLKPLPGQEQENSQYFSELGIAEEIVSPRTIHQALDRLHKNYRQLSEQRIAELRRIRAEQQQNFGVAIGNIL
jgi:processive 1,2-diacylglycerol beta-glucosyltransferase